MNMKKVTKDVFYSVIGPQNVTPYPIGDFPYTSLFKTPSGEIRGKIVDGENYFIIEEECRQCGGTGWEVGADGEQERCPICYVSPYKQMYLK